MPDIDEKQDRERPPFPPWLRELCYFGGILVSLTVFALTLRSDQRSTREELSRLSNDVAAIRANIPNKETLDLRLKGIDDRIEKELKSVDKEIEKLRSDLDFEAAKHQKFKEDLLSKGVLK